MYKYGDQLPDDVITARKLKWLHIRDICCDSNTAGNFKQAIEEKHLVEYDVPFRQ